MSGDAFEQALDAAQEYMALQEALGAALRAGFLSLAQARYSMGADRVSALQLPAHMTATARLHTEDGQLELVRAAPKPQAQAASSSGGASSRGGSTAGAAPAASSGSSSSSAASASAEPKAAQAATQQAAQAAAQGSGAKQQAAGEPDNVAALLQRMQLLAQQSDSLVDELAAKYCGGSADAGDGDGKESAAAAAAAPSSSAAGGDLDAEYEEVAHPSRPLHWFGSLVAPSLRDAEGHFSRALELVVQAANAQAALRRGLERQLSAAAEGGGAPAAGGAAAT